MALTAETATRPASVSLGLCKRTRITRLRWVSTSTTSALAPRRRRGAGSSFAGFLGTFLHQSGLVLRLVLKLLAQHRCQRRDLALGTRSVRRLGLRRRVDER